MLFRSALQALAINTREEFYTDDPSVWTEKPWDLASIAAWNMGLKEEAIALCKKALEFNPTDTRLINNLKEMTVT